MLRLAINRICGANIQKVILMFRNRTDPTPLVAAIERQVILLSSVLRPLGCRRLHPKRATNAEPRTLLLLAEQAYQADRIEQAKRLIEAVYALYD
jgi:hypothetical protein